MSRFINRKKDEIVAVFSKAGIDADEVIAAVRRRVTMWLWAS